MTEKTLETELSETKDSGLKDTAERDKDMLRTGLVQAQEYVNKKKPKVDTRDATYQKYFVENMTLAEKVKHQQ